MVEMRARARTWANKTLDDRRATRRAQLITAGLDLMAEGGSQALTVRAVCAQAHLTERYFYESFAGRDELALAVYDEVSGEALAAIVAATGACDGSRHGVARAAVEAVVGVAFDDQRKGRVLFIASMSDPLLQAKRDELIPVVTSLIRDEIPDIASELDREFVAIGLLGALGNLFYQYMSGNLKAPRQELVNHCVQLLLSSPVAHRDIGRPPAASIGPRTT